MTSESKAITATPPLAASETVPCRNCGTPLGGDFCHNCGQKESTRDYHFADLAGDLVGDLFVWDSRFWRTLLPLVFRPGFLTAEFIAGRKARYMPPLRLYLVVSFLMFLLLSISSFNGFEVQLSEEREQEILSRLDEKLEDRVGSGELTPEEAGEVRARIAGYIDEEGVASLMAITEDGQPVGFDEVLGSMSELVDEIVPDPSSAWVEARESGAEGKAETGGGIDIDLWEDGRTPAWAVNLEQRLEKNVASVQEDPAALIEDMMERLPQLMFLMLPLFALLIQCAYLASGFHYLQHLVFALHFHSAVFLVVTTSMLVSPLINYELDGWVVIYTVVYMPVALVRTYGSGYFAAIGKSLFIGALDMVLLLITLVVLVVGSLITL